MICDALWNKVQMIKSKCQIKSKTPVAKCFHNNQLSIFFQLCVKEKGTTIYVVLRWIGVLRLYVSTLRQQRIQWTYYCLSLFRLFLKNASNSILALGYFYRTWVLFGWPWGSLFRRPKSGCTIVENPRVLAGGEVRWIVSVWGQAQSPGPRRLILFVLLVTGNHGSSSLQMRSWIQPHRLLTRHNGWCN